MRKNKYHHIPAYMGGNPAFTKMVPITKPTLPNYSALQKQFQQILKSGCITNSHYVNEFEERVKIYLKVKHVITVNSCTSGILLVLKALGLKGKVILPSFTFSATGHAVLWNSLEPLFVDCEPYTYNIDPNEVEKAITKDTSCILAVHIFGNPANVESLESIAQKYQLKLVFDAAHGFGAQHQGQNIGCFGNAECFSLSPTKLLTSGEGGIVATNDQTLAHHIRIGRNYGDPGNYDCIFNGLSARMTEFNAVLGLESLKQIEKNVNKRNKIVSYYKERLECIPGLSFQAVQAGNRCSYKDFSIFVNEREFGLNRDQLFAALTTENIGVKKYFYPPLHWQKAYALYNKIYENKLLNTAKITHNVLSLPLYSHIEEEKVDLICDVIENIYAHAGDVKQTYFRKTRTKVFC